MTWTPDRIETVKRLWLGGATAKQISAATGKTRSSVIAKARRLGLPGRPSPIKERAKYRKEMPGGSAHRVPVRKFADLKPTARPASGGPKTCQWIDGEPMADDACKCGEKALPGHSYCVVHRKRAYIRPRYERIGA